MSEKFIISFDTNILRHTHDRDAIFDKFKFGKKFDEIMSLAKEKNIIKTIKILIPEIILMELIEQKVLAYEQYKNRFYDNIDRAFFISPKHKDGLKTDILKFDYKKFITAEAEKYLKDNNIEIIKIKEEKISKIFDRLLKKSLRGESPFSYNPMDEKSKKDFGFKDAVAFETLREYCLETKAHFSYSGIYFISNDKVFKAEELGKEIVRFRHGLNIQQEGNLLIRDIMIKDIVSKKLMEIAETDKFMESVREAINSNMAWYDDIDVDCYDYFNDYVLEGYKDENNFTASVESIFAQSECRNENGNIENVFISAKTEIKCVNGEIRIENSIFDYDDIEIVYSPTDDDYLADIYRERHL